MIILLSSFYRQSTTLRNERKMKSVLWSFLCSSSHIQACLQNWWKHAIFSFNWQKMQCCTLDLFLLSECTPRFKIITRAWIEQKKKENSPHTVHILFSLFFFCWTPSRTVSYRPYFKASAFCWFCCTSLHCTVVEFIREGVTNLFQID